MTSKYFAGNKGHYIFCDICGQACYDYNVVRLSSATGRPGLMVCPNDADKGDPGLTPCTVTPERPVRWTRINHQDVTNAAAPLDLDTTTELGI